MAAASVAVRHSRPTPTRLSSPAAHALAAASPAREPPRKRIRLSTHFTDGKLVRSPQRDCAVHGTTETIDSHHFPEHDPRVSETALNDDEQEAPSAHLPSPEPVTAQSPRRHDRGSRRSTTRLSRPSTRPRYSNAAAAAAASQANDGYKPREERSWEEFHPDLDLHADLTVFTADQVDGTTAPPTRKQSLLANTLLAHEQALPVVEGVHIGGEVPFHQETEESTQKDDEAQSARPRSARQVRKPDSMLNGLGSPPVPRIVPLPTHNPKERLNLPRPSFRHFENSDPIHGRDYVDKLMAIVGYQESERYMVPRDVLIRHTDGPYDDNIAGSMEFENDSHVEVAAAPPIGHVEYDMDEQDHMWLEQHNTRRKEDQLASIKPAIFEITMTQVEREYYALEKRIPKQSARHAVAARPRSNSAAAVNGEPAAGDEPDSKCAICDDGDCENANAIIFCDGCDLAVHQECYGVPFIPEGQWFCRKCKEIGRGTPTCVFCPNIDGAFKQTNTLRWSHLLCAIWIPEVSIANPTFMDNIQDIDKVPRSRWGLHCYICRQRMGACIQCSRPACYQAFHVTCARRARLYLKMKSVPSGSIDTSALRALCDKHVPSDWRREHDVDSAIYKAQKFYRRTMKHRVWANGEQSQANSLGDGAIILPAQQIDVLQEAAAEIDSTVSGASTKRKKEKVHYGWKLASGAPVIPVKVFNAVDASLVRYTVRKRKEFVLEVCKYWTLKREARRGAALLKRLQLQLESSSAMELTRRNFASLGAVGRPKLERRIQFADLLQNDIDGLLEIARTISEREQKKTQDAENLRELIDTVYFPLPDLLWPILIKAQRIDEKTKLFERGLSDIGQRLSERYYTSVHAFSVDLGKLFHSLLTPPASDQDSVRVGEGIEDIYAQLPDGPMPWTERQAMDVNERDHKRIGKRIVRSVFPLLEIVSKQEAELKNDPGRLAHLQPDGVALPTTEREPDPRIPKFVQSEDSIEGPETNGLDLASADLDSVATTRPLPLVSHIDEVVQTHQEDSTSGEKDAEQPPDPWSAGGVPWYMDIFSPVGTQIQEERWSGPAEMRAMSEALSEMDEDTLQELNAGNNTSSIIELSVDKSDNVPNGSSQSNGRGRGRGAKRRGHSRRGTTTRPSRASANNGQDEAEDKDDLEDEDKVEADADAADDTIAEADVVKVGSKRRSVGRRTSGRTRASREPVAADDEDGKENDIEVDQVEELAPVEQSQKEQNGGRRTNRRRAR